MDCAVIITQVEVVDLTWAVGVVLHAHLMNVSTWTTNE